MISRERARRHLESLARVPRPAGGEAEARAREHCARVLREAGYSITEAPFEYSAWPGRYATPAFGLFALAVLAIAAAQGHAGRPWLAAAALIGATGAMAAAGFWLARHGVMRLPLARERSVNLMARRGNPTVWLVAHLDSKSQPVPMLLRVGGITALGAIWVGALALSIVQGGAADPAAATDWWGWIAGAGMLASAPVMASVVGARSPGAIDDASGVATVLLVAEAAHETSVGVLLTSAEELGLAGARAWVASPGQPAGTAINCDGVDDAGVLTAMFSGRAPRPLLDAFGRAAAAEGVAGRAHRLLPGVLVDGVALRDAGWEVVTISKGSVRTLRRIHTPADDLDGLTGDGVAEAARVILRMVRDEGVRA